MQACVDSKIKYGCQFWNVRKKKHVEQLDNLKVMLVKMVMEVPKSTPSVVIQHDFGLIDLTLEIQMEKIILAAEVLIGDDDRIDKQLFKIMYSKGIPGFCQELNSALELFKVSSIDEVLSYKDIRKEMKKKVIAYQKEVLLKKLLCMSKSDGVALFFDFMGKEMKYLQLPFHKARAILLLRSRMFPTRKNFPKRWDGEDCTFCEEIESDVHLFTCHGYKDICGAIKYEMFFNCNEYNLEELEEGATHLILILERLELINK